MMLHNFKLNAKNSNKNFNNIIASDNCKNEIDLFRTVDQTECNLLNTVNNKSNSTEKKNHSNKKSVNNNLSNNEENKSNINLKLISTDRKLIGDLFATTSTNTNTNNNNNTNASIASSQLKQNLNAPASTSTNATTRATEKASPTKRILPSSANSSNASNFITKLNSNTRNNKFTTIELNSMLVNGIDNGFPNENALQTFNDHQNDAQSNDNYLTDNKSPSVINTDDYNINNKFETNLRETNFHYHNNHSTFKTSDNNYNQLLLYEQSFKKQLQQHFKTFRWKQYTSSDTTKAVAVTTTPTSTTTTATTTINTTSTHTNHCHDHRHRLLEFRNSETDDEYNRTNRHNNKFKHSATSISELAEKTASVNCSTTNSYSNNFIIKNNTTDSVNRLFKINSENERRINAHSKRKIRKNNCKKYKTPNSSTFVSQPNADTALKAITNETCATTATASFPSTSLIEKRSNISELNLNCNRNDYNNTKIIDLSSILVDNCIENNFNNNNNENNLNKNNLSNNNFNFSINNTQYLMNLSKTNNIHTNNVLFKNQYSKDEKIILNRRNDNSIIIHIINFLLNIYSIIFNFGQIFSSFFRIQNKFRSRRCHHLNGFFSKYTCIFLLIYLNSSAKFCLAGYHEKRLLHDLLDPYNTLERPVLNESDPLQLSFGLTLMQIIDVDEKNQLLVTNVWLKLEWNDMNLRWNTSEYGGVKDLRIPPHRIWKPDVLMYNSADEGFDGTYQTNVVVRSNGSCLYVPPGIFKSTCKIDITWFPFDDQRCEMKFGSWTYDGFQLDLQLQDEAGGDISSYVLNGEWELLGVPGKRNEIYYNCCPEPYIDITFAIIIRRRTLYYFFNLIVPCVLIASMALLGFTLPPDSGEKLSLGVTILLSLTVFLNMVAETMPATSDAVPLLGTYFNCIMFMVASSVVSTILILNYHHRNADTHEMSEWIRVVFLCWLPWILRMSRPGRHITLDFPPTPCSDTSSERKQQILSDVELKERSSKSLLANVLDIDDDFRHNCRPLTPGGTLPHNPAFYRTVYGQGDDGSIGPIGSNRMPDAVTQHTCIKSSTDYELGLILKEIRFITDQLRKEDEDNDIANDWKFAAMVVDRLCLIIFTMFTILATIAVLFSAPHIIVS